MICKSALILILLAPASWAAVKPTPDTAFEEIINDELELEASEAAPESAEVVDQPPQEAPFNTSDPNVQNLTESPASDPLQTENLESSQAETSEALQAEPLETEPPDVVESESPESQDVLQTEVEPPREEEASPEPSSNAQIPVESPDSDPTKTRYITHPQAEKGLMRISNKGEYFYRVQPSTQKHAGGFNIGNFSSPNIKNPDDPEVTYKSVYGEKGTLSLLVSYEYQFFQGLGKLAVKGGSGIAFAQGHGRLRSTNQPSRERFSFLMMPNNLSLVYRLQLFDKQPLIPYAEVGGDYFTFIEMRNDDKPSKYGGALATHVALGGALSLNWLDRHNVSRVDQGYGINAIYLVGEYRHFIGASAQYDFTSDIMSGGFLFEF